MLHSVESEEEKVNPVRIYGRNSPMLESMYQRKISQPIQEKRNSESCLIQMNFKNAFGQKHEVKQNKSFIRLSPECIELTEIERETRGEQLWQNMQNTAKKNWK